MVSDTGIIMDILLMAIIVDGEIHSSEIAAAKEIITNSKYTFTYESLKKVDTLADVDFTIIENNYKKAIDALKDISDAEKKYILKLVTQITDADKVMHQNEVRLISSIMNEWGL